MKRPKVPTPEEFAAYRGAHCHQLWAQVGPDWICPCCRRSKFQIFRWTKRFPGKPQQFEDWIAVLHTHHDHAQGWDGSGYARFAPTVICDQCNSADGSAKRRLRLPTNFSFSPEEISEFVSAIPHGKLTIDYEIASNIYCLLIGRE